MSNDHAREEKVSRNSERPEPAFGCFSLWQRIFSITAYFLK